MNNVAVSVLSKTLSSVLPASSSVGRAESARFANVLADVADKSLEALRQSEKIAMRGVSGAAPSEEVVSAVMNAERIFNTAMAIRDKTVSAYQEVSRMQL